MRPTTASAVYSRRCYPLVGTVYSTRGVQAWYGA
jgi:hypothetical protein